VASEALGLDYQHEGSTPIGNFWSMPGGSSSYSFAIVSDSKEGGVEADGPAIRSSSCNPFLPKSCCCRSPLPLDTQH
jgi:hypothetical protein